MTTVGELLRWLDDFAPLATADDWDNVGLLWGDPEATVHRVMTCLTVTPTTAREAIDARAEAIVSHHPVLFRAVKRVVAGEGDGRFLWPLARAGVSVLSPHTAFDNTQDGINDGLAARLSLRDVVPLRTKAAPGAFKVVVFTPETDRDAVLSAAFAAGAGRIGAYSECSFSIPGTGTFFGLDGSNPTIGQAGRRESVAEHRIELVCPAGSLARVLAAVRSAHSYEEPAIDVYPLHGSDERSGPGSGRVGTLASPTTLGEFARTVAATLNAPSIQFVGDPRRPVRRVAIICGAGDDFVSDAARAGADVLLTGEARLNRGYEAEARGLGLVVAGHHQTERPGVEDLAQRIAQAFPGLTVWASRLEADPFRRIDPESDAQERPIP
ncbi:MAG: Nif3-like dinuclear metal center hexameric protein [Isosphaeraceae bacterium]